MPEFQSCRYETDVHFAREFDLDGTVSIHVVVRTKGAPKPRETLCGMLTEGLQHLAPHDVMRTRYGYTDFEAGVMGESFPADPFFSDFACDPCARRLAI